MTLSFPLNLPSSVDVANMTLTERNVTLRSTSPFTFEVQAYPLPAQRWETTFELNPMPRESAEAWLSFLSSLRGGYGYFSAGADLNATMPRGEAGGAPIIAVDSLNSSVVSLVGATSSMENWLKAGDYIQVGLRLHKALQNVNTTSGGVADIDVWPSLRDPPSSGTPIIVSSAVGLWRLTDDTVSRSIRPPGMYFISFSATEKIP